MITVVICGLINKLIHKLRNKEIQIMDSNIFLEEFLLLSDIRTWVFIAVVMALFVGIKMLEKKKVRLC